MAVELLRVIGEDGASEGTPAPDLTDEQLLELYRYMLLERILDRRMLALQRQGRIGFYGPSVGQEATIVGAAYATEPQDWIFPQYREPAAALLRGLPLKTLLCQFFGNAEDVVRGRQMPCHYTWRDGNFVSISSCVGSQLPAAVGAAWAAKIRGDPVVALTYFGDGGSSTSDFHVAMNFAGVFRTPTVFVCNNNQYAISLPVARQTAAETIAQKALAYGFEGVRVDGMDVLAVYGAVKAAVDKARAGGGPTLVECLSYRLGPHSSSDDPSRYRSEKEVKTWEKRDPLGVYAAYLKGRGLWTEDRQARLEREIDAEISEAVAHAEKVGPPTAEDMIRDVYADMPPHLEAQLTDLKAFLEDRR
jgi:pyruvate dehydrogenase E1 component alpha subunit